MKIDLHVHTNNSNDGIHDLKTIIKQAKKVGLKAIAITDHNKLLSFKKAKDLTKQYNILVIPGIEIGKIRFLNHLLALNIQNVPTYDNIIDILDFIIDNGGVSIAPHPFSKIGFHDYSCYQFNAVEAINGINWLCNLRYKSQSKIPETANSDAHAAYMLGYTWTEIEFAETVEQVLENVRKGLCKPGGTIVPNHLTLKLFSTLSIRYIIKKFNISNKKGFGYENTFYSNYLGIWTRHLNR